MFVKIAKLFRRVASCASIQNQGRNRRKSLRYLLETLEDRVVPALVVSDLTSGVTAATLAQNIMGPGVNISNVSVSLTAAPGNAANDVKNGDSSSAGTFTGGHGILDVGSSGTLDSGIILSSGGVQNVVGPNTSTQISQNNGMPGDPTLSNLIGGIPTNDATILSFDFVPAGTTLSFRYVFASDEYPESVGTSFNDVFGAFLNDVTASQAPQNVALVPNTSLPVSINTINGGNPANPGIGAQNSQYFINNDLSLPNDQNLNTEMDGLTTVLPVNVAVTPGDTYHIKFAIADANDPNVDSNVFIQAQSFTSYTAPITTITSVTTSHTPVTYGTPVTFTATVTAQSGLQAPAPANGFVDFFDTTTNTDLGHGAYGSSAGLSSTWTLATGAKTLNATAGDTIEATFDPTTNAMSGSSASVTQVVNQRAITVTATTATKVYDGDKNAEALPFISSGSLVMGDTAAFTESYDTKNVGAGKTLTATGSVSDGNGGNNYVVTFVGDTTGQITARAITVTAATNSKTYDGTTSATGTPTITSGNLARGDTAAFTETYDTKNTGAGKTLTATGSVNDGNGGNDYTVTFVTNTTGTITARAITVTASTNTKIYDGTTSASNTPTITAGSLAAGDTAAFTESYDNKNAGTGKTLTATGSVNDGNGGNDYTVTFVTNTTGTITARAITVTASTNTKVYDGTTSASNTPTITSGSLAAGDTAAFTESYDTKNVGTGKTLTAAGSVNDGNGGNDYAVTFVTNTTGAITARAITVTASTNTKVYDGTTSASNTPAITSGSLAAGDTAAFTESYDNRNAGTGKTLTATGSVNDGNGGNDYTVTFVTNTTGAITARAITVTASTNTKVYDGTTSASNTPTITSGSLAAGDTAAFTEAYDNKNAGTGKTLTASGSVNDGNGGNDYAVTFVTNTTGAITARAITVTASTNTKVYDGTTSASNTPTITSGSLAAGDTAAFTEAYDNKNVGTGKTLTATGSVNDGNGGNDYAVTFVTNTTGTITVRAITVTAATNTKVYDGTTSASTTPTITSGSLAAGDTAAFTESYDTKNVGTGKTLTATGSVNDGNGGNDYTVTFVTNTTGAITARAITVTASTNTKVYDGTTSASNTPAISSGSLAIGDTAAFTESYDNKNVGTGKTLTASGSVNDGNGGNDYVVTFVTDTTGQITARAITVLAATNTKVFDGNTSASSTPTVIAGSLAAGDTAAFTETYDTPAIGTGKTLTPAGSVNDGNGGNNYTVTFLVKTNGVITQPGAAPGLYLQSIVPMPGGGFATDAAVGGTALLTTDGQLTVQFATGLANFASTGFNGASLFFMYDHNVFTPLTSIAATNVGSIMSGLGNPDPYNAAKEINVNNTLLANAVYAHGGGGMTVSVLVTPDIIGSYDLVQVNVADPDGLSQIMSPSTNVLIGINLEAMTTVTSTSLILYNKTTTPSKPDVIAAANGTNNTLNIPNLATTTFNATYDFSASIQSNNIASLSLGGRMNSATGAMAAIPTINTSGGTATVYADLLNPMQTGSGLDHIMVVFNYDPTKVTIANPTFGQANSSFQFGTITNGNGVYSSYYQPLLAQFSESPTDTEVVVGINDPNGTHPIDNGFLGDLFNVTFTLQPGVSGSGTTFVKLLQYSQAGTGNPATVLTDAHGNNQTFNPAIGVPPNGTAALNATISYNVVIPTVATTSTLTSSSPNVTYGNTVTFTDSITASSGPNAPALGSVDFVDTTTHTDLTPGGISAGSMNGTVTTVSFTTGVKTFNYTTGDVIEAVYTPGMGFGGSTATTTQVVNQRAITVTAATNTKIYDGTTSASNTPTVTSGSLVAGDMAAFIETYDTAAIGTGKTLTPSGSVNDGNGGNNYAVTFVQNTTGVITVQLVVALYFPVLPEVAGVPFLITVTAEDANNQPIPTFNDTVDMTTSDPQGSVMPASGALNGGVRFFIATLETVGSGTQTITATDPSLGTSGTSIPIPLVANTTSKFVFSNLPASVLTDTPMSPTVTAEDAYGNPTPLYTGTVHFTSTDPKISAGSGLPANYTFTSGAGDDNGVHTFTNGVTLLTPGVQTITVTDTSNPKTKGSASVTAIGLQVTSIVPDATGFTVNFNKPFDPSTLKLYATGPNDPGLLLYMTNTNTGPSQLTGSVVPNANNTAFTFVETFFGDINGGLPNGVYDVSLLSSPTGLADVGGAPLDTSGSLPAAPNLYSTLLEHAESAYSNSFTLGTISPYTDTTQNTPTQVAVSLPAFAQGPGLPVNVQVHNSLGHGGTYPGIPATISDGNNASTVSFGVTYNTAQLTVTGGMVDPSIAGKYPHATFSRTLTGVPVGGIETDTFTFSTGDGSELATGSAWTLGDITASVPNTAGQQIYQSKQLLTISNLSSDGAAHGGVTNANLISGTGFEVVAYLGDTTGDGNITMMDATVANNVGDPARGGGFRVFPKVDPVVLADTDGAGYVDANSVGNIAFLSVGVAEPSIPTPPAGRITAIGGPDPDLSLPGQVNAAEGLVEVPVNLSTAMPTGSTGLTQATLDLTYDPRVLSVSPADVHLGSLPALGTGWKVASVVNQAAGQLVIQLFSTSPLAAATAGSLVTVDFHTLAGAQGSDSVSLVDWANPTGQVWYRTSLSDLNGALTLGNSTGLASILGLGTPMPTSVESAIVQSAPVMATTAANSVEEDRAVPADHLQASLETATEGVTEGAAPVQAPPVNLVGLIGAPVQVLQIAPPPPVAISLAGIQQQLMDQVFRNLQRGPVVIEDQNVWSTKLGQASQAQDVSDSRLWNTIDWLSQSPPQATTENGQIDNQVPDSQDGETGLPVQVIDDYFALLGDDLDLE